MVKHTLYVVRVTRRVVTVENGCSIVVSNVDDLVVVVVVVEVKRRVSSVDVKTLDVSVVSDINDVVCVDVSIVGLIVVAFVTITSISFVVVFIIIFVSAVVFGIIIDDGD